MPGAKYLSPLAMLFSGGKKKKTPSYKKGGRVRHSGKAMLHKGERVLNKKQAKRHRSKQR
jgi:hypothetical protein